MNRVKRLLSSLNCDGRRGAALLATCAALLAIELKGEPGRHAMRYDRTALAAGEWWRLITGHLAHLDLQHAVLNCLGLALLWALFARDYRPWQWLLVVLTAITAIDIGLWFSDQTIAWYVGSSGVLHGVMAAGTVIHVRRHELDGWILAAFLIFKLSYEQIAGALPLTSNPAGVVVDAHLFGAIGGVAAAVALEPFRRPSRL